MEEKKTSKRPERRNTKKKNAKRKSLITLCVILSVILVLLVGVAIVLESTLGLINRDVDNDAMSEQEYQEFMEGEEYDANAEDVTVDPNDINWDPSTGDLETSDSIINILLIGQDRREGQGRQRSDAMILCTLNLQTKTLTMTSFMRDMYVQIPGYSDNRINVCYPIGGMELLDECLNKNFGVVVDGNVEVDFGGFMDVIELIGGVDMELTESEAQYLNRYGNWDVSDTAWTWDLKEGMNHLTGEQALAYSRIRDIGNGDFGRTERQRKVISAVLEECKSMSIAELNGLLRETLPLLTTDMSNSTIIGYAMQMIPMLTDLQINTLRIPVDGGYYGASINNMSVLVPDLNTNRQALSEAMQK